MNYDPAFNLTKVRNKALKMGDEEEPWNEMNIMELNEADQDQIQRIKELEAKKKQAEEEI